MKKYVALFLLLFGLSLSGCQFDWSQGIKKDYSTGITVSNEGLSYDEDYLSVDGERLNNNGVKLGDKVYMVFSGVDGFAEKDGKVFPGAAMQVTDREGKTVLEETDMFAAYDQTGVDVTDAGDLSVSLLVGDPMISGESYDWKVKFWDKLDKGEIKAEVSIDVL